MNNQIQLGDIGSFKDPQGHKHNNCIVVHIMPIANCVLVYDPNFSMDTYTCLERLFTKTNGMQDTKTRKMNFEYAKQHSGNDNWQWTEDET